VSKRISKAPQREVRMTVTDLEVRASSGSDGGKTIAGHAARFDSPSEILVDWWEGAFREVIDAGAFSKTLEEPPDVRALINHDPNLVLGRSASETLRLEQDDEGLAFEIDAPDTTFARDLEVSMDRGDINQMSFAFRTIKDSWGEDHDGIPLRHLQEVSLRDGDVSVVTYPAYQATDAAFRALQAGMTPAPVLERIVADVLDVDRRSRLFPELADAEDLTDESRAVVRRAVDALTDLLSAAEPTAPTVPLAVRRRQLEILDLTLA